MLIFGLAVNCSAPSAASGVIIEPYSNTTEGAIIYYNCVMGYGPQERIMAMCTDGGIWSPNPINKVCQTSERYMYIATITPLDVVCICMYIVLYMYRIVGNFVGC